MLERLWRTCCKTVSLLFDTLLPQRERVRRVESLEQSTLAPSPSLNEAGRTAIVTLLNYKDGAVRDCVQALKYDASPVAVRLLAAALEDYLREEVALWRAFSTRPIILTPMPLHPSRQRERGFNQVERVLAKLPREFHDGTLTTVRTDLLVRSRATLQQTRLPRHERLTNVADAFSVLDANAAKTMHIVLIDDVMTTGATLAAAGGPLDATGAIVTLLALARA